MDKFTQEDYKLIANRAKKKFNIDLIENERLKRTIPSYSLELNIKEYIEREIAEFHINNVMDCL